MRARLYTRTSPNPPAKVKASLVDVPPRSMELRLMVGGDVVCVAFAGVVADPLKRGTDTPLDNEYVNMNGEFAVGVGEVRLNLGVPGLTPYQYEYPYWMVVSWDMLYKFQVPPVCNKAWSRKVVSLQT